MTADEALIFVELLLAEQNKRLNDIERIVFKGAWNDEIYEQIHRNCRDRSIDHIKRNVGPRLWKKIAQAINRPVSKMNLQGPIEQAWQAHQSNESLHHIVDNAALANPILVQSDELLLPVDRAEAKIDQSDRTEAEIDRENWYRFVPDVPLLIGRATELDQLAREIRLRGCRLLVLYGLGGVGKTALAAKLGQAVWDQFQVCIWRSIEHRPPLKTLIADLQTALGDRSPQTLLDQLRDRRCLIVLDGYEALLQSGVHDGAYLDGYEKYGQWIEALGQTMHQSCIILTSREEPKEIVALKEAMTAAVQSFPVRGLRDRSVRALFNHRGNFSGSEGDWWTLMRLYDGNLSALNEVAAFIRDSFSGNLAEFLQESQEEALLDNTRSRIEKQFARSSPLEQQVVNYLAQHGIATFAEIHDAIQSRQLRAALNSLRRRSLLEIHETNYELTRLLRRYLLDAGNAD